jgi:hypothetical protein
LKDSDYFAERTLELFELEQYSPWPGQDGGHGGLTGMFSPATRVWPRRNWSYTIYRMVCTCWWVVGTKKGGGARSTARNGGGRGGASVFPVRGRRTWRDGARTSIVESWGCYFSNWFSWRWGGSGLSTWRWLGFYRWQWRHGIPSIPAEERIKFGEGGSRGK